jgi:hypothetical protein
MAVGHGGTTQNSAGENAVKHACTPPVCVHACVLRACGHARKLMLMRIEVCVWTLFALQGRVGISARAFAWCGGVAASGVCSSPAWRRTRAVAHCGAHEPGCRAAMGVITL